jgi:hypothetical protein
VQVLDEKPIPPSGVDDNLPTRLPGSPEIEDRGTSRLMRAYTARERAGARAMGLAFNRRLG